MKSSKNNFSSREIDNELDKGNCQKCFLILIKKNMIMNCRWKSAKQMMCEIFDFNLIRKTKFGSCWWYGKCHENNNFPKYRNRGGPNVFFLEKS